MIIQIVSMHVKPEYLEAFKEISTYNADNSRKEPGIWRFDLLQQKDDPQKFAFVEVFRNEEATAKHRETEHYQKWRETVGEMLVEPRTAARFQNISPDDQNWG
jgi:quinol monooxygenase YgiN